LNSEARRVEARTDGRGHHLLTGSLVGNGDHVGGGLMFSPSAAADRRRFRVKHALHSIEDALHLLAGQPAEGIEIAALERIRDDLAVILRLAEAECR
jgi:hypothetical protein